MQNLAFLRVKWRQQTCRTMVCAFAEKGHTPDQYPGYTTGTTMEGEATAHYLKEMAEAAEVKATRIAYGIPVGGDLEYVDSSTLSLAISSRREY